MVGLMLSRGDGEIIREVMTEYAKQMDTIFCIDSSEDQSIEAIRSFDSVEYAAHEKDLGISVPALKDGVRQLLLSRIQDKYGYEGWIFPIQSDEIYEGKLENLLECGLAEGANVLNAMIAQFVPRKEEIEADGNATKQADSIQELRKWYFLSQCETAGFKNHPGLYYNFFEHMRVLPHGFTSVKVCERVIIRKHYNLRNADQINARIADRLETGWQPSYAAIQKPYIEHPSDLITAGIAYSDLQCYDGHFPIPEGWEGKVVR